MKQTPRLTKRTTAYGLLDRVCELITEEPQRYFQGLWILRGQQLTEYDLAPACGTVGCVAGWVAVLATGDPVGVARLADNRHPTVKTVGNLAQRVLGISTAESVQLFDGDVLNYLSPLQDTLPQIGSAAYAALGVQHIRAFQQAHAKQLRAKNVQPFQKIV